MTLTKIENLWNELEVNDNHTSGLLMKRHSASSNADYYVSIRLPEKIRGIAFRFDKDTEIDIELYAGLKDIKAEILQKNNEETKTLVLSLIDDELLNIFGILAEDLFESISELSDERKVINQLNRRFSDWKTLFDKVRDSGLSLESQTGLFGELVLLKKFIENDSYQIDFIDAWKGPENGIRDFEYDTWAVEVKTSKSHNPQSIMVNSVRQLDTTLVEDLFLFHISIESRNGVSYTLNHIIDEIRQLLSENVKALNHFNQKLLNSGYFKKHENIYNNISYSIRNEQFYLIKGDFPRLEEKDIPNGIGEVKYSVLISSIQNDYVTDYEYVTDKFPRK